MFKLDELGRGRPSAKACPRFTMSTWYAQAVSYIKLGDKSQLANSLYDVAKMYGALVTLMSLPGPVFLVSHPLQCAVFRTRPATHALLLVPLSLS